MGWLIYVLIIFYPVAIIACIYGLWQLLREPRETSCSSEDRPQQSSYGYVNDS